MLWPSGGRAVAVAAPVDCAIRAGTGTATALRTQRTQRTRVDGISVPVPIKSRRKILKKNVETKEKRRKT